MSFEALAAQPVIIIGAGRSGTNMLRDVLTSLDGVSSWPCDEINYIWRHGNRTEPLDEFSKDLATTNVKKYIRKSFATMIKKSAVPENNIPTKFIVEKTCANSLRVDFVNAIVPEAKYLFLVRDGRDVIASAKKRWQAPLDISYLLAKARYVPVSDLAYYSIRYIGNRFSKLLSSNKALSVWGPKFAGMNAMSKEHDLDYICAAQWARCIELSEESFKKMPTDKVLKIRYEDFVADPVTHLANISGFLGMPHNTQQLTKACAHVRAELVGKGHKESGGFRDNSMNVIRPILKKQGYLQ